MFPNDVSPPRAWAEVSTEALRHNYRTIQKRVGGVDLMAVVKANGYGHGVRRVWRALEEFAPRFYGVANVMEARELASEVAAERLYLLGAACPTEYQEIVQRGFVPCVSSLAEATAFDEIARSMGKTLGAHVALDTGMGRGGFLPEGEEFQELPGRSFRHLRWEGIGSHLPVADEDEDFTKDQMRSFQQATAQFPPVAYRHISNSAGTLHYPLDGVNLVRPGLALYGLSPIESYQEQLKPALRLKSRISLIRTLPAGCSISYGRTYRTTGPTRVATVGIGYGDGYQRALSGTGVEVLVHNQRVAVIGRITMDQIMLDVTSCPTAKPGSEVELFGENLLVSEVAAKAGTIPWELLTAIAPRVERYEI